ncbi:molybdopterin dinucleotide binding domain-containing protein [Gordonia humi]|uniref:molybdopterin dinucleotide binding domain-containing protein n=1 Tax=Gordonia humi TaxID=686429 RepID=UPI003621CD2B
MTSSTAAVTAELRLDEDVRSGVATMPHGWGHTGAGLGTARAASTPGANYNALVDDTERLEALTNSPVFNGVRIDVAPTASRPQIP